MNPGGPVNSDLSESNPSISPDGRTLYFSYSGKTPTDVWVSHKLSIPAIMTGQQAKVEDDLKEWNNRIRREKFDIVLPEVMRKNNVDMWIHVMRIAITDPFGAEELGSTSGVFIFTDRYLFWWDHEQAIATENGVEYLSPPQKELYLIK